MLKLFKPLAYSLLAFFFVGCGEEAASEPALKADFGFEYLPENTVRFSNTTPAGYAVAEWDFGNGTTAKNQSTVEVFYPSKGDYTVRLDVWKDGVHSRAEKTVSLAQNAIDLALKAEPVAENKNYIQFSCNSILENVKWDFGARGSSTQAQPKVYFPFAGKYTVQFSAQAKGAALQQSLDVVIATDDPNYLSGHQLVWGDEFDGSQLDTDKWLHETGAHGWGNNEWQNYTNGDNTTLSNGLLKITAKKIGAGQKVGDYTSSRINSKQSFLYGRFEFRAKMPELKGKGLWPALWMLGESIKNGTPWPNCGEIDMMEYVSYNPHKAVFTIHSKANNHGAGTQISSGDVSIPDIESAFHLYGIIWSEKYIKFYLDKPENVVLNVARPSQYTNDNWPFDKPFYFLMNMAVGGNWGGAQGVDDTIFPAVFDIDYIRVYQHPDVQVR